MQLILIVQGSQDSRIPLPGLTTSDYQSPGTRVCMAKFGTTWLLIKNIHVLLGFDEHAMLTKRCQGHPKNPCRFHGIKSSSSPNFNRLKLHKYRHHRIQCPEISLGFPMDSTIEIQTPEKSPWKKQPQRLEHIEWRRFVCSLSPHASLGTDVIFDDRSTMSWKWSYYSIILSYSIPDAPGMQYLPTFAKQHIPHVR